MLHLIKLAVGARDVDDIARHQARAGPGGVAVHTRQFPKRAASLVDGGSLYWVVAGLASARQRIRAVDETVRADGTRGTLLRLDPALIPVAPRRVRAFQGWRYLEPADAPADLAAGGPGPEDDDLPARLRLALAELGLL